MRIAFLDCFSGVSGDMFLGAAVDAGVSFAGLEAVAARLGLGVELRQSHTERAGIAACKVDVLIGGRADQPAELVPQHSHEHHGHTHEHHAPKIHAHTVVHEASQPNRHIHRGLKEIRRIIAAAEVSEAARAFALRAFALLAEAEGRVHNCDAESIHFHEAGSEDAIVDILCAGIAVEKLKVERWYASALNVGSGTVRCAHGTLPVPAPAVVELLRGAPVYSSGVSVELLTPTGAAILRALDVCFDPLPPMRIGSVGYGAGARELPGQANVLRLCVGESAAPAIQVSSASLREPGAPGDLPTDTISVLEANLDDMNPQLVGHVQQKLLEAGALDVYAAPVQMKKGRPGVVLTVLAAPAESERLTRIILTETTTLGVRIRQEQRRILERRFVLVESEWGPIPVKLGCLPGGEVVNAAPEFEDCRRIAESARVPLKHVLQQAMRLYLEQR